ncbi:MAG TPA: NUDIX domain-containing protein [Dehalococcoidia bacterium]|nr:NUDIX domain-containing protein [Dehalococcoidia bacterium]
MTSASTNAAKLQVACLIAVNARGEVLLMQRDEKPGLSFPGHWNLIGGGVEAGETPEQALVRETDEEIGVSLAGYRAFGIYFWKQYEVHVFVSDLDLPLSALTLGEGQDLRFFSPQQTLDLTLVPITIDILRDFFASPAYLAKT